MVEQNADYDGLAVVWGIGHFTQTVEECAEACRSYKPALQQGGDAAPAAWQSSNTSCLLPAQCCIGFLSDLQILEHDYHYACTVTSKAYVTAGYCTTNQIADTYVCIFCRSVFPPALQRLHMVLATDVF